MTNSATLADPDAPAHSTCLPLPVSMTRLSAAMFLSSVGAVLFSLSIFRMLSFFIMPSMFFALLLVGFPIGAALASRWGKADVRRFQRMLTILQAVMILSILATLFSKHADYMRANLLFGIDPRSLLVQILIFALIFLPFFAAYGAAEYVGYLAGTQAFGNRMRPVYGLFLFGGAAAFGLAALLQRPLGVPRLLLLAVMAVAVSWQLLANRVRWHRGLVLVALLSVLCWPGFGRTFMDWFKISKVVDQSVAMAMTNVPDSEVVHSEWGRYAYIEIIRRRHADAVVEGKARKSYHKNEYYTGFYNDVGMWNVYSQQTYDRNKLHDLTARDRVPFLFLPEGGSVAIIGSGGGRDAISCRRAGAGKILALEIEPAVVEAIQGPLRDEFSEAYTKKPVSTHIGEARRYFKNTDERFDMLFIVSVGSYPQMMLEPGNMIRTTEAFRLFADRLTPNGVMVISYALTLDPDGVLLQQYNQTLRLQGMHTEAFFDIGMYEMVLFAFPPDVSAEQQAKWSAALAQFRDFPGMQPVSQQRLHLTDYRAITDDRPFMGGNISQMLSVGDIQWMFKRLAVLLGVVGVVLWVLLYRSMRRHPCPVPRAVLLALSVLVGANFLLLEHLCVIQLFRHLYAYYDCLVIGIVGFLTLTGIGSLLIPRRLIPAITVATLILAAIYGWWGSRAWPVAGGITMLVPTVLITGTFFPLIFELIPAGRLQLFSMDAVGAALGTILAFFIPMLFGLQAFTIVAVSMFLITGICMLVLLFYLRRE